MKTLDKEINDKIVHFKEENDIWYVQTDSGKWIDLQGGNPEENENE